MPDFNRSVLAAHKINPTLVVFVLVFACIGAYFTFRSFANDSGLPGDINDDNVVNMVDVSAIIADYQQPASQLNDPDADVNGDGVVNILDVSALLSRYGLSLNNPGVQATFYIDPVNGSDANNGTSISAPFKTIDKARRAVDDINDNMRGSITVYLRGGTYKLDAPISFGTSDSGSNGFKITYKAYNGERAVLSGGENLSSGWTLSDSAHGIYKRTGVNFDFRELYVNDQRGTRARTPNQTDSNTFGPYKDIVEFQPASKTLKINKADFANASNLTNGAEFVINLHEFQYYAPPSSVTTDDGYAYVAFKEPLSTSIFTTKTASWWDKAQNGAFYWENSLSYLDAAGEWYLDRATHTLYYKPKAGETMNTTSIIAPKQTQLINITGTSTNHVHNLLFEGLSFEHTGWTGPDTNGVGIYQGADAFTGTSYPAVAAFTAQYADNINVYSCNFRFTALAALDFVRAVNRSTVYNSTFNNLGGNAITMPGKRNIKPTESEKSSYNRILNNTITHVGQEYTNAMGIIAFWAKGLLVQNNEIGFVPYTGMQIGDQAGGVGGGFTGVGMMDNVIRHNKVHDTNQLHDDGGGIYTLAPQTGAWIYENYLYNQLRSNLAGIYPVTPLYLDNYSQYITVEHNNAYSYSDATYEQTCCGGAKNNNWINNILGVSDPTIQAKAGPKANFFFPIKTEAERMSLTNYQPETDAAVYVNGKGIKLSGTGKTGQASSTFSGASDTYSLDTAYIADTSGGSVYRLYVDGNLVDTWSGITGSTIPSTNPLQIRHHAKHGVSLRTNSVIRIESTQSGNTWSRLDYLTVY